jgi:hypothetical protein
LCPLHEFNIIAVFCRVASELRGSITVWSPFSKLHKIGEDIAEVSGLRRGSNPQTSRRRFDARSISEGRF